MKNDSRLRFRVWHNKRKLYIFNVVLSYVNGELTIYERLSNGRTELLPKEHIEIEQSTGIKDAVGNFIYENDIIWDFTWWWGAGYVYLAKGCGPCKDDSSMSYICAKRLEDPIGSAAYNVWNGEDVLVLGNIHQDKEILEYSPEQLNKYIYKEEN